MHNILHADDPPHRLALGVAIGMFVAFTPTVGLQSGIVLLLAWRLGANKLVGLPLVWITNPVTLAPIYFALYRLGAKIIGAEKVSPGFFKELTTPPPGWLDSIQFYWLHINQVLAPLLLGCLIASLLFAIPTYFVALFMIRNYRLKRWGQLVPPLAEKYNRAKHTREIREAKSTENSTTEPNSNEAA